jgi:hypothetical protein
MGIARATVKLLMREGKHRPFYGKILTISKQDVYAKAKDIAKWAKEMDYQLKIDNTILNDWQRALSSNSNISDMLLFSVLGFDSLDSIDVSAFECCTIVHDLNKDIPIEMHGKYDLLFDGGTTEHIFNFPKVLENYNKMLKVGGRIIHNLPSSNHVDHGFYMFCPNVFYEYYLANKWEILESLFFRYTPQHDTKLWDIYEYRPYSLSVRSYGGLGGGMYGIYFVIKKTEMSTTNASVQQASYALKWGNESNELQDTIYYKRRLQIKKIANMIPSPIKWWIMAHIIPRIPLKLTLKRIARY